MGQMLTEDMGSAALAALKRLRDGAGRRDTVGLDDDVIVRFARQDARLMRAIEAAGAVAEELAEKFPEVLDMDEADQVRWCQDGLVNFYAPEVVNPYVAAGAKGPWVVTLLGAVIYDTGGYGMLGWGHNPDFLLPELAKERPMANVMTANPTQRRFLDALRAEIGHTAGTCPYVGFMCLNSGSEAMSLACRIADALSGRHTGPGGRYAGATVKRVVQRGAFHGRTERPAALSDSSRRTYTSLLASFAADDSVLVVEPGDVAGLEQAFADARANNWFIELVAMEPVMGEGNPGYHVPRAFYEAARRLTKEHGSLFLVDSVQAGLRTQGTLSAVDYPEYAGCEAPDIESYSKAIHAGQFPLSVLALGPRAVEAYRLGIYGNTMTGNPRALAIASAVLAQMTPELRANIVGRGQELTDRLDHLRDEFPGAAIGAQGSGLLVSLEVDGHKVFGHDSMEEWLRMRGLGVIHGGQRSLRFTPVFDVSEEEVDLIVGMVRSAFEQGAGRLPAEA